LKTYKLKFGHHGANHPVMDLRTRRAEITSQNHNFAVQIVHPIRAMPERPPVIDTAFGEVLVTHLSLNDHSIEGLACTDRPVFSVQYHPEASPGPHDSAYLFTEFIQLMEKQHV
ncbi:MAG TPA: carbamoyl phosphate synthase small subunit, partial [Nitrospiraceae bacterium]|nr:carbamoyl phosphate synthase small subunit [Nitrospiraceae bacterium]